MDTTGLQDDAIIILGERSGPVTTSQRVIEVLPGLLTRELEMCIGLTRDNDEHALNIQESRDELKRKSRKFHIRASYDSTQFRAFRRLKRANKAANKRAKLTGARNRIQNKRLVKQSQQLFLQRSRKSASLMRRKVK